MAAEQLVLPGFHDPRLVVLSVLISILGAYAARDLIEGLRDARGRAREELELVVADDGTGFDPSTVSRRGGAGGWGMITMRERAEAIGGTLTLESAPTRGTRLIVNIAR
jgi:signal transduction histidine kinase